jgi:hypothetical protein
MGPGDTCAKAGGEDVQTYEQRVQAADAAKPVILGLGLLVAGFGTVLFVSAVRRARPRTGERVSP